MTLFDGHSNGSTTCDYKSAKQHQQAFHESLGARQGLMIWHPKSRKCRSDDGNRAKQRRAGNSVLPGVPVNGHCTASKQFACQVAVVAGNPYPDLLHNQPPSWHDLRQLPPERQNQLPKFAQQCYSRGMPVWSMQSMILNWQLMICALQKRAFCLESDHNTARATCLMLQIFHATWPCTILLLFTVTSQSRCKYSFGMCYQSNVWRIIKHDICKMFRHMCGVV